MYIYCMYVELKLCILIITSFSIIYGISDDIILMSPCPRLFGCSGNDQVVESPVVLATWRRGGGVPIPEWNGMHSPLESETQTMYI